MIYTPEWFVEHDYKAKTKAPGLSDKDLTPDQGPESCKLKQKTISVPYSAKEIALIKKAYSSGGLDLSLLAKKLKRPKTNICRYARIKLGLTNKHRKKHKEPHNKWFPTELQLHFLREMYDKLSYKDLSGFLDFVSTEAIRRKLKELGLQKPKTLWHFNKHPQGMNGKTHSKKYKKEISERVKKQWQSMTERDLREWREKQRKTRIKNNTLNPLLNQKNPYSRSKGGKRKDLGNIYFRSAWEANIARYFNYVGIKWEYETKTFIFHKIKKGCVSYTVDFYLPKEDRYVEVKGWMDPKSKTKLNRFKKYYPHEYAKLEMIGPSEYRAYLKWKGLIEGWES